MGNQQQDYCSVLTPANRVGSIKSIDLIDIDLIDLID